MIYERFDKLPDDSILRRCEIQTELAEWVRVGARGWVRRMRRWRADDGR